MYLSEINLNLMNEAVRRDLSNMWETHRTLMSLFPTVQENKSRNVLNLLFRIYNKNKEWFILFRSAIEPDFSLLPEDYCKSKKTIKYELSDKIQNDSILMIQARLNPIISTKKNPKGEPFKTSKRVAIRDEDELIKWFNRKSEQAGFSVLDNNLIVEKENDAFVLKDSVHKFKISSVLYTSMIKIQNRDQFEKYFISGLGHGKSFGFGMINIVNSAG